jgi:SAM-dependent MidA family methyltransferase
VAVDCFAVISARIRQRGPITAAEFMDLALYAPGVGYYARAAQRSGRTGDFFTSVDVGPLFGTLLGDAFADLLARMHFGATARQARVDLVEVAAGNGRLSRDLLDGVARRHPELYESIALHLVERSEAARAGQAGTLAGHAARLVASGPGLPASIDGIVFANELLDAFPVHVVQMTRQGLGEIYVGLNGDRLVERLATPSTPALAAYLDAAGVALEPGMRGEINLAAIEWVRDVARRLVRGHLVLIDYGFEAPELYSPARPMGTLAAFHRHLVDAPARSGPPTPAWLADPGERDLTSHVDLTSVRRAAEQAGLTTIRITDQTRFVLDTLERGGLVAELDAPDQLKARLALKTLLMPGSLGSTHKVLVFARGID